VTSGGFGRSFAVTSGGFGRSFAVTSARRALAALAILAAVAERGGARAALRDAVRELAPEAWGALSQGPGDAASSGASGDGKFAAVVVVTDLKNIHRKVGHPTLVAPSMYADSPRARDPPRRGCRWH
jgi:hypothetical protein